jgi:hypothetical protein
MNVAPVTFEQACEIKRRKGRKRSKRSKRSKRKQGRSAALGEQSVQQRHGAPFAERVVGVPAFG